MSKFLKFFFFKMSVKKFYNVTQGVDSIIGDYLNSHEPSTGGVLYDYKNFFGHEFPIFLFNYTLTWPR